MPRYAGHFDTLYYVRCGRCGFRDSSPEPITWTCPECKGKDRLVRAGGSDPEATAGTRRRSEPVEPQRASAPQAPPTPAPTIIHRVAAPTRPAQPPAPQVKTAQSAEEAKPKVSFEIKENDDAPLGAGGSFGGFSVKTVTTRRK